ncbi:MAG: adenine phosphoribosyltransferase [Verrucomicrobia bacterium]|nr:adenine phosphoribosyltransferase [Verrucomicrobiota bacterium]MBU1735084.1 adenine phosphoribosyltransferase [Verrucomicrobiota bacterium]MBU1855696.1 adenine phosphoribosyltransferase [Verrucomicrobiota bacterium]
MNCDALKKAIREVPDFPKPGILFYDITPILADAKLFQQANAVLCERHVKQKPKAVAAIDARGFIFGAAVAQKLGVGFIPIRKKGKLPFTTLDESYDLEYGSATISVHVDAVKKGDKILIVDDLLATGGTAAASARLIERLGGTIVEIAFLIELAGLKGRTKLTRYPVFSAIVYEGG